VIALREKSKELTIAAGARDFLSGQNKVNWLEFAADGLSGKVMSLPTRDQIQLPVNEQQIVELYSK
jgi:small subunit ribosomal protein S4